MRSPHTIANAANRPINLPAGTVPDVSGALKDWFQPLVFVQVIKSTVAFQVVETKVETPFLGVVQPFTKRQLQLKPEGQRAWSWLMVHADPVLTLQVDDVGIFLGKQTRVMGRLDFANYGYVEYVWLQDFTGSGP